MVNLYYRKYKQQIDAGKMTVDEAIEDARVNVPAMWRDAVISKLEQLNPVE